MINLLLGSHLASDPAHGLHIKQIASLYIPLASFPFLSSFCLTRSGQVLKSQKDQKDQKEKNADGTALRFLVWRIKAGVVREMKTKPESFLVPEEYSTQLVKGDAQISSSDFHNNFQGAVRVSLDQDWKLPHQSCLARLLSMGVCGWWHLSSPAL